MAVKRNKKVAQTINCPMVLSRNTHIQFPRKPVWVAFLLVCALMAWWLNSRRIPHRQLWLPCDMVSPGDCEAYVRQAFRGARTISIDHWDESQRPHHLRISDRSTIDRVSASLHVRRICDAFSGSFNGATITIDGDISLVFNVSGAFLSFEWPALTHFYEIDEAFLDELRLASAKCTEPLTQR